MPTYLDRRGFLVSLPALALAPRMTAQPAKPQIKARGINHVLLTVSDLQRSIDFYQGLFGLTLRRTSSSNVQLAIGSGPQHLALGTGPAPTIDHYCLTVEGFDVDGVVKILADHGIAKSDQRGPM